MLTLTQERGRMARTARMGRTPHTDRSSVTTQTLSVKISLAEKVELEELLVEKNETARIDGRTDFTISSYMRGLLLRDLAARRARQAENATKRPPMKAAVVPEEKPAKRVPAYEHEDVVDGGPGISRARRRKRARS